MIKNNFIGKIRRNLLSPKLRRNRESIGKINFSFGENTAIKFNKF